MKWAVILLGLIVFSCSGKRGDSEGLSHAETVRLKQYMVAGRKLYMQHCSNCHQPDGQGLAKLFPPLNKSDFVDKNFERVICIMRYGLRGEIMVNGITFNQPMPAIPQLTDLEIAEIATYIYNSWGREEGPVNVKTAAKILRDCRQEN